MKSAYRLLTEVEAQERAFAGGQSSHSAAACDLRWKKLWRQRVPPKVRVFWWKVINDYMPCRANLYRRHIDQIANCEVCGTPTETTFHALVECVRAKTFWRRLKEIGGIKLPGLCPRTWATDLLDDRVCKEDDRTVIMCGMWSLWSARNDRNHGKDPIDPKRAIEWAIDTCFLLLPVRQQQPTEELPKQRWHPPPSSVTKVNCDGGFSPENMTRSTGAIIRNSEGSFLVASAQRLPAVSSALAAEKLRPVVMA